MSKDEPVRARRIEVFTGAGHRRSWLAEEKAAIVAESFSSDVSVSEIARRHGLAPAQLFAWRRAARRPGVARREPAFVPVIVEEPEICGRPHEIELDIGGGRVWIWRGADAAMVTNIIGTLKPSK